VPIMYQEKDHAGCKGADRSVGGGRGCRAWRLPP
jgi:hypothetical protein